MRRNFAENMYGDRGATVTVELCSKIIIVLQLMHYFYKIQMYDLINISTLLYFSSWEE